MQGQYLDANRHLELARRYQEESDSGELASIEVDADASAAIVALLLGLPERARQQMERGPASRGGPRWLVCILEF